MESKFNKGDRVWTIYGSGEITYIHFVGEEETPFYLVEMSSGKSYGFSEEDIEKPMAMLEKSETHKPIRYEVLPGIQAWDILTPICNRFSGVMAGYIFNIGKYFLRLGMKYEVKKELMKMREYIDKAIEEVSK